MANLGRKGNQLSYLLGAGGLEGPEPRPLRGEGSWNQRPYQSEIQARLSRRLQDLHSRGSHDWRWRWGVRQLVAQVYRQSTPHLLFSQNIKDAVKMFITLTLILTNQEGGVIGRTVTKTWEAMTDCIILQFATARKGNSEQDSAQTPLLLEKRINKGQSRASSDSVAKESQHSSAGRGNSGRFNSDAIIMDRPNNT